jgi:hypothetical protein
VEFKVFYLKAVSGITTHLSLAKQRLYGMAKAQPLVVTISSE